MNALPKYKNTTTEVIEHWRFLEQYAQVPKTKTDYNNQIKLLNELISLSQSGKNKHITSFLKLIASNIDMYEKNSFAFDKATAVDALKYLMEEHGLTQANLPEIGSQSLISKILKGERKLTAEHITNLSKRFHVSPTVFLG